MWINCEWLTNVKKKKNYWPCFFHDLVVIETTFGVTEWVIVCCCWKHASGSGKQWCTQNSRGRGQSDVCTGRGVGTRRSGHNNKGSRGNQAWRNRTLKCSKLGIQQMLKKKFEEKYYLLVIKINIGTCICENLKIN